MSFGNLTFEIIWKPQFHLIVRKIGQLAVTLRQINFPPPTGRPATVPKYVFCKDGLRGRAGSRAGDSAVDIH